jgi:hypothetical protein
MVTVSKSHENGNSRLTPRVPEILTDDALTVSLVGCFDCGLRLHVMRENMVPTKEQIEP